MTAVIQVRGTRQKRASDKKRTSKSLLKEYPKVKEWYDNLKRSSPANADKCLQRLEQVRKDYKITPAELAKLSPSLGYSFILKVVTDMDNASKQPTYQQDFVKSLKSWFAHNGKQITQKVKLGKSKTATKVQLEQSPMPEQVRRVLDVADPKQKVESVLVGFSGFRPESVGNYLGDDGLKVGDLPEMEIDNNSKTVTFKKIPTMVIVRDTLSKAGHQYFSYMPQEGCDYLKNLLEIRMRERGEILEKDTPIINSINHNKHYGHIRTSNVGDSIRTAIRKAGYDWRPYILRTYFDTRMLMAEADGLIVRDFRVFFMGHKGSIEAVYTTNKRRLPEDLVEKMREAFAKASEKHLVTIKRHDVTTDKIRAQFNEQMLRINGFTQEQITELGDLSIITDEQMADLLKKHSFGLNGKGTQKVVPRLELKKWIGEGWELVDHIDDKESIIRLPKG